MRSGATYLHKFIFYPLHLSQLLRGLGALPNPKQSPLFCHCTSSSLSGTVEGPLLSTIEVLSMDSTVAISYLYLEDLGYFDEKKEKDKKNEVRDEGSNEDNFQNNGEEDKK